MKTESAIDSWLLQQQKPGVEPRPWIRIEVLICYSLLRELRVPDRYLRPFQTTRPHNDWQNGQSVSAEDPRRLPLTMTPR